MLLLRRCCLRGGESLFHCQFRHGQNRVAGFGCGDKAAIVAEARAFDATNRFQLFARQAGPGRWQVGSQFKTFIRAADASKAPIVVPGMDDKEQVVGAGFYDGGPKWHAHRQLKDMPFASIGDRLLHQCFGAQFGSACGQFRLDEAARDCQRGYKTAIIRFGIGVVEDRL